MSHTIAQALAFASTQQLDRLDAQLLALHALGREQQSRAWLIAHDDDLMSPAHWQHFEQLVQARAQGQPLAYLVGQKEFFGLSLAVSPAVLVPRPDTETLVQWALDLLQHAPNTAPAPSVLDLGTGSGAVALAIKANAPSAHVTGLDSSEQALMVAQHNGAQLGLDVEWLHSNWLQAVGQQRFSLMVSNPPYIELDDLHMAQLQFEPQAALTSGTDGLDDIRHITQTAAPHLLPGAWLLLEHGWNQAEAVAELLQLAGFANVQHRHDLGGHIRCTGGQWV